jgi:hypothetical protein
MEKLKLSKSVTLTMDNVLVIEQMMTKTKTNFSKTLNYVLSDWIKIRQELSRAGQAKKDELELSKQIQDIKKAKVIKE